MNPGAHALGRRLSDLRAAHEALATEVRALEAGDTYALLAGGGLTGTTAERARSALAGVAEHKQGLAVLDDLLGQVEQRTGDAHLDDSHAARLMALVNGPNIVVHPHEHPAGAGDPALSPAVVGEPRRLTFDELLASYEGALTPARRVVAEIDATRRELVPRLDRVTAHATRLAVELPTHRPLAAARAALDTLARRIVDDPLGAADEVTVIETVLAAAAGARGELVRTAEAVAAAARTLADLEGLVGEGRAAFDRSRSEVAGPDGLLAPLDLGVLGRDPGLRPWLARLERLASEGETSRASAGLERWRALADQTLAVARQVADANARPWRRRRELQGLLRATRVKAGAMGRAEDPQTSELAERAARSLAVPCDLPAAEAAVEAFLAGLRQPMASSADTGRRVGAPA